MNYIHSGARRGKPKRILDPSAGLSPPVSSIPQNPYLYNQQISVNNDPQPEYGFDTSQPSPPSYGFNIPPVQAYNPNDTCTGFVRPQFTTQLLTEPIVTNMAVQYGSALVGSGKQQLEKYLPTTALKYYFAVDTNFVLTKLALLLFPFMHKDWSIKYEQYGPLQPRYERNAPDMYIPTMAFLTYLVMAGFALGTQERFSPEQLGILASSALALGIIELLIHTIILYGMNLDTSLKILDLFAYCGYKYVGVNVAILISLGFQRFGYYIVLFYFSVSLAFFLVRSLKLRVIPQGHSSYTASENKKGLYFILFVAAIQPFLMWWLSFHLISSAAT